MEKGGGRKNRWLIITLIIMAILIIGLIIGIVLLNTNNSNSDSENTDEETSELAPDEAYINDLVEKDTSYQTSLEISKTYNSDGGKEKAMEMYDEAQSKALAAQDYDSYIDLVISMSTLFSLDGTCEESMALYDKIDFNQLPEDYRDSIYAVAINDSARCNDAEHETYWRNQQ